MNSIDYGAVRRYFEKAGGGSSSSASYMAHGEDLPEGALRYRFSTERAIIEDWLEEVAASSTVLDLGCGAGAWSEYFATRYRQIIGLEGSSSMVEAAKKRTSALANVEILEADVRAELPEAEFDFVFLGGLCMYLNDGDLVDLLKRVKQRLAVKGMVLLRESTVPFTARVATGDYGAVYRTPADYQSIFEQAGFLPAQVRRNLGYTAMEMAIEVIQARRRWLPFLPFRSPRLSAMTWWSLRACAPLSFGVLPRALESLKITWPALQNHFFLLRG